LTTLGVNADAIIIGSVRKQPGDDRSDGDDLPRRGQVKAARDAGVQIAIDGDALDP
jgi:hypothetical protein